MEAAQSACHRPFLSKESLSVSFIPCPICGSSKNTRAFNFIYSSVVRCSECGMHYNNPQITLKLPYYDKFFKPSVRKQEYLSDCYTRFIINYLESEGKHDYKDLSVLDIGCSYGFTLLNLERHGFQKKNLYGIDVSKRACNFAVNDLKMNVENKPFHMNDYKDNAFDIIVMAHTIEHMEELNGSLSEMHRIIKPDGKIFLIEVPNISKESLDSAGNKHPSFTWPVHYWHFDETSIELLLKKTGLDVVHKTGSFRFLKYSSSRKKILNRSSFNLLRTDLTGIEMTYVVTKAIDPMES